MILNRHSINNYNNNMKVHIINKEPQSCNKHKNWSRCLAVMGIFLSEIDSPYKQNFERC